MSYMFFFVSYFILLFFIHEGESTIISKSDITICENTGKDPLNVLYNKGCEKKLVVVAEVMSGQGETEKLYATVNKVYDNVEREDARLYNPFIVTLSMSPVTLVYPIFYRGTVNNKPYEVMSSESYGCSRLIGACRTLKDSQGNTIFDSEGFCCQCERESGLFAAIRTFAQFYISPGQHFRGKTNCGKFKSSRHCMRFDSLWYDVHEIGVFTFDFTIWVKTYDQAERVEGNRTIVEWVDGGELALSPKKTGGVGKYGRVVAKYIGQLSSGKEYPRLHDFYMMIPNPTMVQYEPESHPQLKNGYEDYLIIPVAEVEFNSSQKCDVIGVTLAAFAQQSTWYHKSGYGCHQKEGTCLRNQIKDYFEEDELRRDLGQKTKYFPDTYGKITGLKQRVGSTDRVVEFESEESTSAIVYLEISADDLILVYNRAGGIIVKAFAKKFEAMSRNGLAVVVVQNTGYVTADYYVTLEDCSNGIRAGAEKRASINPQTSRQVQFNIEAYMKEGGSFSCNVNLYDSRRTNIDTTVLSINTTNVCVCIMQCGCSCVEQDFVCVNESDVVFDQEKPGTYSDWMDGALSSLSGFFSGIFSAIGGIVGSVGSIAKSVVNIIPNLGKIFGYVGTFFMVAGVIVLLCVLKTVCDFVPTGIMSSIAKKGIKSLTANEQAPPAPTIVVITKDSESETEDSDGNVEGKENVGASEAESLQPKKASEIFFEFFFFFILPFLLAYKVAKLLWRYTLRPVYLRIKGTLFAKNNEEEGFYQEEEDHPDSDSQFEGKNDEESYWGENEHSESNDSEGTSDKTRTNENNSVYVNEGDEGSYGEGIKNSGASENNGVYVNEGEEGSYGEGINNSGASENNGVYVNEGDEGSRGEGINNSGATRSAETKDSEDTNLPGTKQNNNGVYVNEEDENIYQREWR